MKHKLGGEKLLDGHVHIQRITKKGFLDVPDGGAHEMLNSAKIAKKGRV
jgi:hypothetical protein